VIRDFEVTKDEAGFPIVRWTERRNRSSPEATSQAMVECRVMKEAQTGELLFVARGSVRHGLFEEGRPWERLNGFRHEQAEALYYTREQLQIRQHVTKKGIAQFVLSDGANVILGEFGEATPPLHINCAEGSPVDINRLHLALIREFITRKEEFVSKICRDPFLWPKDDDRVLTYDPDRTGWEESQTANARQEILGWIVAVAIIAALGAVSVWLLGVFPR
jgi:hypothetical protein